MMGTLDLLTGGADRRTGVPRQNASSRLRKRHSHSSSPNCKASRAGVSSMGSMRSMTSSLPSIGSPAPAAAARSSGEQLKSGRSSADSARRAPSSERSQHEGPAQAAGEAESPASPTASRAGSTNGSDSPANLHDGDRSPASLRDGAADSEADAGQLVSLPLALNHETRLRTPGSRAASRGSLGSRGSRASRTSSKAAVSNNGRPLPCCSVALLLCCSTFCCDVSWRDDGSLLLHRAVHAAAAASKLKGIPDAARDARSGLRSGRAIPRRARPCCVLRHVRPRAG